MHKRPSPPLDFSGYRVPPDFFWDFFIQAPQRRLAPMN